MTSRTNCCLGLLTLAVGYAVVVHGGDGPLESSVSLLVVSLAAIVGVDNHSERTGQFTDSTHIAALLLAGYVAFQLVPLSLGALSIVSPARAEIARALDGIGILREFAPLSISPPTTWAHLSRVVGYTLIFLLIRKIALHSAKNSWTAAVPLVLIATFEAIWAISQSLDASPTIGTYFNKNHFAGLMEMVLPFPTVWGLFVISRHRNSLSASSALTGCALLVCASAIFVAIASSSSKGGLLSTLGSLLVMGMLGLGVRLSGWRRWVGVGALMVVVVTTFVFLTPTGLVEQFGVVTTDDPTEGRVPIWRDAIHLIAAYPLFGVGLGNFYPGLLRYQTVGLGLAWTAAHNDYLQWLAELGLVGFVFGAVLLGGAFVRAARAALSAGTREAQALGLACTGSLAAILTHSLSEFNTYVLANAMVLAWVAGLSTSLVPPVARKRARAHASSWWLGRHTVLALGCLLAANAAAWVIFLQRFQQDPKAERVFCRFGICDTNAALSAAERLQDGDDAAVVALDDLREFLSRDPAGSYRWADLGDALHRNGQIDKARYAFARAVTLAPNSPPTLLRAAGFYFDVGENPRVLDLASRSLQAGPEFDHESFVALEQIPVDEVLRYGLPDRRSSRAYLRQLMIGNGFADAGKAWSWMVSRGEVDDKLANEYVEFLFRNKKPEAAAEEWAVYSARQSTAHPSSNLVFNGDFESNPTGSRFDWKIETPPGAAIDFDTDMPHSGRRSLRIHFDGSTNTGEIGVEQAVFLKPGRYRFRAHIRTREVSTDEGVHFLVVCDETPKDLDVATEDLRGSNEWTMVECVFDAPPGGGLVRVLLARKPSLKFDSKIAGTVWIDDVSLTKGQ